MRDFFKIEERIDAEKALLKSRERAIKFLQIHVSKIDGMIEEAEEIEDFIAHQVNPET